MMRKSLLIAALGAVLPMFMSDVTAAAAAPLPPGDVPATPIPEAGAESHAQIAPDVPGEPAVSQTPAVLQVADDAGNALPSPADADIETRPLETKTYADGSSATGYGLPDVSPIDNVSPTVSTTQVQKGDPGNGQPGSNAIANAVTATVTAEQAALGEAQALQAQRDYLAQKADVPNAGATPAESASEGAAQSSVPPASAGAGASPTDASSLAEQVTMHNRLPLRMEVAQHLEAIYRAVADADKPAIDHAVGLKEHIGDVLHKIRNGMDVRSGELVQKLETLFHKL